MAQSTEGDDPAAGDADPLDAPDAFERLVAGRGVAARPYQVLLRVLGGEGLPFDEVVRRTALPRRAVEEALRALGDDVETVADRVRLRPGIADVLARRLADDGGREDGDAPPAELLARIEQLVRHAPRPKHELDHVAATPETVARRALVLHRMYALRGRRVLLVGDRDLTSLALALVDPTIEIAVADIDDDVLAYIDQRPEAQGRIRCAFADFRLGLPPHLRSWADLAVTDPPYTPDGIALFVRRALEGLADLGHGRIALAYGYGDQPKLGLKVQDALHDLRLVHEAILPAFHRYTGAQAIGSASDLYLLRATSDTKRELARRAARTTPGRPNVYTHGRQSLEGGAGVLDGDLLAALRQAAAGPEGRPVVAAVGSAWSDELALRPTALDACLFPPSLPRSPCSTTDGAIMADLRHDSGSLLVRLLLAARAPRLAVLVRNQHPDITSASAQAALQTTIGPKYTLRYRRSFPTPQSAIVEAVLQPPEPPEPIPTATAVVDAALHPPEPIEPTTRTQPPEPTRPTTPTGPIEATEPTGAAGDGEGEGARVRSAARRFALDRPHGKLGNVAREALIAATARPGSAPLTKNTARTAVAEALAAHDLDARLLDLPRHALDDALDRLATAASHLTSSS
jgi:N4-bis(aminopropyl)spermidine synthase